MLPVNEAEAIILNEAQPMGVSDTEIVDLWEAVGRVVAVPVTSQLDFPHWDNSAMDGYAVRYADVSQCSAENPAILDIIEEIPAGYAPQMAIAPRQAARILTGSMMPSGADTVVMQENTRTEGSQVYILTAPTQLGAFVRRQGEYYQAGAPLLDRGTLLSAPEIAVLAAAQCVQVSVFSKVRVAIISTGSELVSPDRPLQPGQIVDSNQYALAALIEQAGGVPLMLGIVPDNPQAIREAIAEATQIADIILSSGGVSVGDYDYVDSVLADLGAKVHFHQVAIKPGKPLTFATFSQSMQPEGRSVLYFGLPGNPVSALVTAWRFVVPALKKRSGLAAGWQPKWAIARSRQPLKSDGRRETYLWGQLIPTPQESEFELATGSHSSGNLINLARTNALAVLPVGETQVKLGERVKVLYF
ncbi:molybdopterin molybdotransferase MoeA [Oscillatoria laete-virens NRMC-F 0139]|nr:gephyrin-like molybdotransferase Glp [Oscillatoria laete-virens]MDL5052591.1 molybdopterin molybdotransferase MoeA [Oscillatoria laete-virens NRMC-F 0139]